MYKQLFTINHFMAGALGGVLSERREETIKKYPLLENQLKEIGKVEVNYAGDRVALQSFPETIIVTSEHEDIRNGFERIVLSLNISGLYEPIGDLTRED